MSLCFSLSSRLSQSKSMKVCESKSVKDFRNNFSVDSIRLNGVAVTAPAAATSSMSTQSSSHFTIGFMFYLSESFLIDACKYLLSQSCTFSQFIIYNGVWCYTNTMCIYFECRMMIVRVCLWRTVQPSGPDWTNERGSSRECRICGMNPWIVNVFRFFSSFLWYTACSINCLTRTHGER